MRNNQDEKRIVASFWPFEHTQSVGLIYYWIPLLAYAGTIALISSLATPRVHIATLTNALLAVPTDQFSKLNDKMVHIAEYAVLGLLTHRAVKFSWGSKLETYAMFLAIVLVGAFGVLDELHQWFVPTRDMESLDLIADIFGGVIGVSLWEWALTIPGVQFIEEQLPRTIPWLNKLSSQK